MRDHIKVQVARYLPEKQSEQTFDEHEVPCPKDWVILDGLNYIKDRIDGTLAYRWSCRMGICGSCGMTVNGEPKLTCATFLADYGPGPVRIEPLRNFPIIRDLIVDKKPSSEIKRAAHEEGMTSLRESAVSKVLAGETTLREINKVTFIE